MWYVLLRVAPARGQLLTLDYLILYIFVYPRRTVSSESALRSMWKFLPEDMPRRFDHKHLQI